MFRGVAFLSNPRIASVIRVKDEPSLPCDPPLFGVNKGNAIKRVHGSGILNHKLFRFFVVGTDYAMASHYPYFTIRQRADTVEIKEMGPSEIKRRHAGLRLGMDNPNKKSRQ
jgi:hypothetical protein